MYEVASKFPLLLYVVPVTIEDEGKFDTVLNQTPLR